MTIQYVDTYRTTCIQQLGTAIGSAGKIIVYGGTQPAKGAAAGTALVTFTGAAGAVANGAPFFSSVVSGVGTVNVSGMAVGAASGGLAPGTNATWARITTSADVFVADMTVSASGGPGDMTLDAVGIVTAATITITSMTITAMGA